MNIALRFLVNLRAPAANMPDKDAHHFYVRSSFHVVRHDSFLARDKRIDVIK